MRRIGLETLLMSVGCHCFDLGFWLLLNTKTKMFWLGGKGGISMVHTTLGMQDTLCFLYMLD